MPTPDPNVDAPDRAWVDIDLGAVVSNARRVADVSGARLLPMVKANGYGLGAVAVAKALERLDPWGYGVATVEEGAELRAVGISRPVLLFTPQLPGWMDALLRHRLTPVICDIPALERWLAVAPGEPFHLGIDTGMARAGIAFHDSAAFSAARALTTGSTAYQGACTHFHSADTDPAATELQWTRLQEAVAAIGPRPPLVHAANSAAALTGRRYSGELVRPGIFLFGGRAGAAVPEPVAALRARVVALRRVAAGDPVSYGATWRPASATMIATVAAGYADGLPRSASGRGQVEIGGRLWPIRGRVTMDMTLVEVDEQVRSGDVATVYGGMMSVDEQAGHSDTVSYELLTALGARVERRYQND